MKQIRWVLLILIIQCGSLLATPDVGPPDFAGAKWIWDENAGEQEGTWAYRKGFAFPAGKKPVAAKLAITCDNRWTLYVNGYERGKSNTAVQNPPRPVPGSALC